MTEILNMAAQFMCFQLDTLKPVLLSIGEGCTKVIRTRSVLVNVRGARLAKHHVRWPVVALICNRLMAEGCHCSSMLQLLHLYKVRLHHDRD